MKIFKSFGFAWNGLKYSFITQTNFKIHLFAAVATTLLGISLHISATEWLIVLLCFAIVLFAELINTALEKLCDVVQQELHPKIKLVKDIAAGAVLVSAIISAAIGMVIFLPKIIWLIRSF
jgi:diacylglycerol kinase